MARRDREIGIIGYGAMAGTLCCLIAAHSPVVQVRKVLVAVQSVVGTVDKSWSISAFGKSVRRTLIPLCRRKQLSD
jgi:hypothetical protein